MPNETDPTGASDKRRAHVIAMRRAFAGTQSDRPMPGAPTRLPNGEWMQRVMVDLPEAMHLELEDLAAARGVPTGQLMREALVAFGVAEEAHVVGIRDGSYRADDDGDGDVGERSAATSAGLPGKVSA